MSKSSIAMKVLVVVLGVMVILSIGYFARISAPKASTARTGADEAQRRPDPIPACSAVVPDSSHAQTSPAGSNRHSVTLSWIASTPTSDARADAIKGYYVYRSQTSQSYADSNRISTVPLAGTQCVDATVEPRATYYYVVKSVTQSGAQSVVSKEIKAVIPFP